MNVSGYRCRVVWLSCRRCSTVETPDTSEAVPVGVAPCWWWRWRFLYVLSLEMHDARFSVQYMYLGLLEEVCGYLLLWSSDAVAVAAGWEIAPVSHPLTDVESLLQLWMTILTSSTVMSHTDTHKDTHTHRYIQNECKVMRKHTQTHTHTNSNHRTDRAAASIPATGQSFTAADSWPGTQTWTLSFSHMKIGRASCRERV